MEGISFNLCNFSCNYYRRKYHKNHFKKREGFFWKKFHVLKYSGSLRFWTKLALSFQLRKIMVILHCRDKTRVANFFFVPNPQETGLILTGSPILSVTFSLWVVNYDRVAIFLHFEATIF